VLLDDEGDSKYRENDQRIITRSGGKGKNNIFMDASGLVVRGRKIKVSKAKHTTMLEVGKGTRDTLHKFFK